MNEYMSYEEYLEKVKTGILTEDHYAAGKMENTGAL